MVSISLAASGAAVGTGVVELAVMNGVRRLAASLAPAAVGVAASRRAAAPESTSGTSQAQSASR